MLNGRFLGLVSDFRSINGNRKRRRREPMGMIKVAMTSNLTGKYFWS
jgi:hypothetical protein